MLRTALLLSVFVADATSALRLHAQSPEASTIALRGVALVDPAAGRAVPDRTILLRGDRIEAVLGAAAAIPADAQVIDGRGTWVVPGLIDTHVHLTAPVVMQSARTRSDTVSLLGAYVAYGVTSVRDAGSVDPLRLVALRATLTSAEPAPRIRIAGVVNPEIVSRRGAADPLDLVKRYARGGVDGIKIRNGLTNAEVRAVIEEAGRAGVTAFGHTYDFRRAHNPDFTLEAVAAGAAGVMHVLGIAPVAESEFPEATLGESDWEAVWLAIARRWLHVDPALQDRLIRTMVARRAWLEPTLVTEDNLLEIDRYRSSEGNLLLSFPFDTIRTWHPRLTGAALAEYRRAFQHMQSFVRQFHDAGGIVVAGSDVTPAPGVGLHEELRLLVAAGLSPAAALRAATAHAAQALGWGNELGAIEPGRAADLVLLEGNPLEKIENTRRITAVVMRGRYLDRAELDRVLARARGVHTHAAHGR